MNIVDLVFRQAALRPDRPAIQEDGEHLTYAQLCDRVRRTAGYLRGLGTCPGDRIGLSLKDNTNHLVALLAVARLGATIVPIDWRARPREKEHLAAVFDVSYVLAEVDASLPSSITVAHLIDPLLTPPADDFPTNGKLPFLLNLSSGTSGTPKAAIVTHDDYRYRLARYWYVHGATGKFRYLSVLPLCFSAGRNLNLYHLTSGGTVTLYPSLFGAEELVDVMNHAEINFAFLVPTALRWLLELPHHDGLLLPKLDVLATGTAFLYPEEKQNIVRRISPNLYQGYSTSGTGNISVLRPHDLAEHGTSVGVPNPLTTVEIVGDTEIVGETGKVLPTGEIGRLRCRGPGIATRYYNQECHMDAEGVRDGWFYTGEFAALDRSGYLHLHGRVSNMIVRGGANVYPEEVERVLLAHPAVAEVAVVGRPSRNLGEEVIAAVVPRQPVSARDLLTFCRSELSAYKIPAAIAFVDALPKTTSGKVRRADIPACLVADAAE